MDVSGEGLQAVLGESRRLGFLGPGPVEDHVEHAEGFVGLVGAGRRVVDLGSGGGLPGLVLAVRRPDLELLLVDAMEKRCRFLRRAVGELGLSERVRVDCGRAEELARDPRWRSAFDVVVARSFGPPATTAECAVGFLAAPGSHLLVSEPPDATETVRRWPPDGLVRLGLAVGDRVATARGSIQILEAVEVGLAEYPRRVGVPAKRPLF